MKRYKATILKHSESDLTILSTFKETEKTKFEDTTEYKTLKKDLENADKAYNQSLTDDKMDEEVYLDLLNIAKDAFYTLLATQVLPNIEDSIMTCVQLGKRVIFVENYHEVDLLDMPLIKLEKPFYIDTGTEYITITKDNFKEYDKADILKEKTDKYDEPIEIINN